MFEFAWPWIFILSPLPLLVYFCSKPIHQEKAAIVVPFYAQLLSQRLGARRDGVTKKMPLLILLLIIWILLLSSAARPQWVGAPIALANSGRDLLLAVDISDSMDQADMELNGKSATRLEAVKQVVSDFIERRKGDRIGLVLFGTNAYLQAPLTFDTDTVKQFLNEAQLGVAGPKTAIGDAIGLSVKRLRAIENPNINNTLSTDRVVILLTDGANTAGEVEPLQAAQLAEKTNIKIYTIGIGADEMVVRSLFGPRRINPSAQLDEKTLVSIAETTGAQYFRARQTDELNTIYKELDKLEPIESDEQLFRPSKTLFFWPLSLALLISMLLALLKIVSIQPPSRGKT